MGPDTRMQVRKNRRLECRQGGRFLISEACGSPWKGGDDDFGSLFDRYNIVNEKRPGTQAARSLSAFEQQTVIVVVEFRGKSRVLSVARGWIVSGICGAGERN